MPLHQVTCQDSPLWTRLGKPGRRTRILILKVDHIGDMILAFPAMEMLRDAFQSAHFTLVCSPGTMKLAQATGMFDEIIPFKFFPEYSEDTESTGLTRYSEIRRVVRDLYDLAIDLRFDIDTRPLLKHVEAYYRAGYVTEGEWYCKLDLGLRPNEVLLDSNPNNHSIRRMQMLASAVINVFAPPKWKFLERLVASDPATAQLPENFVVLAPGAGTSVKKWPHENFAALGARIHAELAMNIVVIGGAREKDYAAAIAERVPAKALYNFVGTMPLLGLPPLLSRARGFVGNDTGFTHLSAMMGVPTLCLFSGSPDLDVWRPMGSTSKVIKVATPCSPCRIVNPAACTGENVCMTDITPEKAFEEFQALLASS